MVTSPENVNLLLEEQRRALADAAQQHYDWVKRTQDPCVLDSAALLSLEEREIIDRAAEGGFFDGLAYFGNFISLSIAEKASALLGRAVPAEAFWRSLDSTGWVEAFFDALAERRPA